MLELAQSLGLDLTDAFAGDLELLADFLQGVLVPVAQAEAHLEDLRFALGKAFEGLLDLLAQIDMDDGVGDHDLVFLCKLGVLKRGQMHYCAGFCQGLSK